MNEHDARILAEKNKPADDLGALGEFVRSHHFCQACGRTFFWQQHTVHHMIGGRGGRADEPCNLLYLCWDPCHMLAEGLDVPLPAGNQNIVDVVGHWWSRDRFPDGMLPKFTLGVQLNLKIRAGELDEAGIARLTKLHGRRLPDLEPIPKFFVNLFRLNRPELRHACR